MKKIIPLILIAISFTQYGGYGPPKIASISGNITDYKTEKPVPYATITLFSMPNNEAVDGIMCDDEGSFLIMELMPGTYNIVIESIGYEKNIIENFSLNRENGIKRTIGTIKLVPKTIDLEAVNVIEERSMIEFETDKMIFNASDDIISAGGTAEDVLRKVPMVTVDLDGKVNLRGNENVKILIDGRDSRFGSDIDNIPSSMINQVEVITSPSAKYDPEGMAGIINIKLKKGAYDGLNGKIKLNGRYNDRASIDKMNGFTTFLNYKHEKFNIFTSVNLKNRFSRRESWRKTDYTDLVANTTSYFHYDTNNETIKPNKSFKIGGEYFLSDQLTLNSELNWGSYLNNSNNTQIIKLPELFIKESGKDEDKGNYSIEGVLGISKSYDNPDQELNFEISFDQGTEKELSFSNSSDTIYHTINDELETEKILINDSTPTIEEYNKMNIDFSYRLPINKKSKIELGYDGRIVNSDEKIDLQLTDTTGYTLEANLNSIFQRNIHGVYFEYENKLTEKFSIKPSIRLEYVNREISYEFLNDEIGYYKINSEWTESNPNRDENYNRLDSAPDLILYSILTNRLGGDSSRTDKPEPEIEIYPDLHFTYNITKKQSIQFGMSKRVERPGSSGWGGGKMQIRPFPRDLYSTGTTFVGDPFLKSAYTTTADISYKSPIPMGFMMLNGRYSYTENPIKWDGDNSQFGKNITTFANAEYGDEYGTDFFLMIMGQTLGGGITKSKFKHSNGDPDLNESTTKLNMFMGINLPEKYIKLFDFEFGFYWMKFKTNNGTMFGDNGTIWANIGLGKSFLDNQFKVSFKVDNLFNAGGFQMDETYTIENSEIRTRMNMFGRPRTLTMNLSYSFGKMENDKFKGMDRGERGGGMDMGF